jgi:acetyl esterase/lipase
MPLTDPIRRAWLAGLTGLSLTACSPADVLNAVAPRSGVRITRDIAYGPLARHRLDIYAPESAQAAPVVVFYYGGGWEDGGRALYRFLGAALAAEGVVCVIPDYRLFPEVRFPAFIEDGAAALAWAKRRYPEAPLFIMGHSAGAHIAAMLALDARFIAAQSLAQRDLRGLIGLAGPYDFLPLTSPRLREIFGPEAQWPLSQPINFVTGAAPPALLVTGSSDSTVRPENTTRLAARLRAADVPVQTALYDGIGHVELIGAMAGALRFLCPVREDVLRFVRSA